MIKLSDYVFKYLEDLKVKHTFLLSGGGCMHLVDSLGKLEQMKYIPCLHEQAAVIAAATHAQYTNNLGVALVTTGPGGTNAVTGVAGAWVESAPLLVLSGQVKRQDIMQKSTVRMLGFQEVDIVSIVKSITKYAVTVMDPNDIRYHLEKAIYFAFSGRHGPVWLDIPLDVQAAMIDEQNLRGFEVAKEQKLAYDISNKVSDIINLINKAERPVILAGNGIKISKAEQAFLDMVTKFKIPVLTTWKAIDLMTEDNPYFFGRPGAVGQRAANFIQQNSDLIITIGARLDFGQIGYSYENFAKKAKKVIIDIDQHEINKLKFKINIELCTSASVFINEMLNQINKIENIDRNFWLSKCKDWNKRYPVVLPEYFQKKEYVSTYVLMDVLSEVMTEDDVLVPGSSGACSDIPMQTFRVKKGQRILNSPSLGSMGYGVPSSIGACLASGNKRTICTNGDGGFQLNIQELATVKRLNLPIKYFVLNNGCYGCICSTQRNYFDGRYVASDATSGVAMPDPSKIAAAYEIQSVKIENQKDLKKKVEKVLAMDGPVICEVLIDPLEPIIPRLTSAAREDGTIVTKPLEDLFPFLDRAEFESNML